MNQKDKNNQTFLHAIINGIEMYYDSLQYLYYELHLTEKEKIERIKGYIDSYNREFEVFEFVIKNEADINFKLKNGKTIFQNLKDIKSEKGTSDYMNNLKIKLLEKFGAE